MNLIRMFYKLYRYDPVSKKIPERFYNYIMNLSSGKSNIEFIEDFFLNFHLPGLLRRMDCLQWPHLKRPECPLLAVCYGIICIKESIRWNWSRLCKTAIEVMAEKLGLTGALQRRKIGSALHQEVT